MSERAESGAAQDQGEPDVRSSFEVLTEDELQTVEEVWSAATPLRLDEIAKREPEGIVVSDAPGIGYTDAVLLSPAERDALVGRLEEAESALRSALEDCHPSVEAYFKRHPEADRG